MSRVSLGHQLKKYYSVPGVSWSSIKEVLIVSRVSLGHMFARKDLLSLLICQ